MALRRDYFYRAIGTTSAVCSVHLGLLPLLKSSPNKCTFMQHSRVPLYLLGAEWAVADD